MGKFFKTYLAWMVIGMTCWACTNTSDDNGGNGAEKPNIVFILADDMGIGDLRAYNTNTKVPTPNIDQLSEQGMIFTDAHSSGSWCVPSRYGLLTGEYPMRTEMNWRERNIIAEGKTTIGTLLQDHEYQTGMVGKWHLGFDIEGSWNDFDFNQSIPGGPLDNGFDYYFGIPASLDIPPYFYIENKMAVNAPTDSVEASHTEGATSPVSGEFWRAGKIAPGFKHEDVLPKTAEKSLSFLDEQVNNHPQQPFFLYLALSAPHTPWLPSSDFRGKSEAGLYGDFTMQVDHVVGQIMDKLDALGVKENTLVVFTSDNGPLWFEEDKEKFDHLSASIYRGMKGDHWEGGHRIPLVIRWPGKVKPGSQSGAMVNFTDFMDTFRELLNDDPNNIQFPDSYSFLPVLLGNKQESERNTMMVDEKMVRKDAWKLIFGSGMGGIHQNYANIPTRPDTVGSLYNLDEDIGEENNLYEEKPQKVKELRNLKENIENKDL